MRISLEKLDFLDSSIRMQMHPNLQMNFEYLSQLQAAITNQTVIHLDYTNAKEESTKRKLEPIGLIFYAFSWHLIGWCYLRKDYRDFKLQRIKQVQVTEQSFQKKDHISIQPSLQILLM